MHNTGKGGGKGGKGGNGSKGGPPGGERQSDGTRKCINCASTAHLTKDCPRAEVPREQRPCWKRGKAGHIGANCPGGSRQPSPPSRAAGLVDRPAAEEPMTFFMVAHEDAESKGEFIPAKHTAKVPAHPVPKGAELVDFMISNQYAALAEQSADRRARRRSKISRTAATCQAT